MALASKVELTLPVFPGAIGSLVQSATVQPQEVVTLDITKGLSPLLVILKVAVTGFFHKIVPNSSVDVARYVGVSKPSVCHAVNVLCDGGFLTKDDKHFISLTEEGRKVAEKIYERHKFFKEQLISAGVSPNIAETEACRIEHCVSDESFLKLKQHHEKDKG